MRSFFQSKTWILVISLLALAALMVLAVSLRGIPFENAQPIGQVVTEKPGTGFAKELVDAFANTSLNSQVALWVAAALLVSLISMLLTPEGRKSLLRIFIRAAITYWMLYFLVKNYGDEVVEMLDVEGRSAAELGLRDPTSSTPPPVFTPPQSPSWLMYLSSLLVTALVFFVIWRMVLFWRQNQRKEDLRLKEIAKIARASLRDLKGGMDSTDVIMNCYFRMSQAVEENRKLARAVSMTPSEFAVQLERAGLPADAVQKLTRLFEGVRYGGKRSDPRDVNEAIAALTSILNYCGESV